MLEPGTVTQISPLLVRLDSSATAVPAVALASYFPVLNDRVSTDLQGAQLVVVGALPASGFELIPPGVVLATAIWTPAGSVAAPAGWLACDGVAVSRTTYARLWAVIGGVYGSGDGSSTFNLPNLCGKVVVGIDPSESEFATIGQGGGEKYHSLTVGELPSHSHQLDSTGQNAVINSPGSTGAVSGTSWGFKYPNSQTSTELTGSNQAHNNLQPYIAMSYIIKF